MYRFLGFPNRVVVLGLEADDSCEERCKSCDQRAVQLWLEWNSNLRCLGSFFWHTHWQFGNFRVVDNFGLDWT